MTDLDALAEALRPFADKDGHFIPPLETDERGRYWYADERGFAAAILTALQASGYSLVKSDRLSRLEAIEAAARDVLQTWDDAVIALVSRGEGAPPPAPEMGVVADAILLLRNAALRTALGDSE